MSMRVLKDPATVNSRIFVGHLQTDDTNKAELEEYFSKYGVIVGSAINRGFGFIQFDNDQSAQNAIQSENGSMFKGRRIDVKPAKKDPSSISGQSGGGGVQDGGNQNNSFSVGNQGAQNMKQNFNNENQFGNNDQFKIGNQNNSFGGGNQNQSFGGGGGAGASTGRVRKSRGGRNKKREQGNMQEAQNFRDRSPISRGNDMSSFRDMNMSSFRSNFNDPNSRFDPPGPMIRDTFGGSTVPPTDYVMAEKNDCEIIVVSKIITEYAEMIETRLKKMGLTVDLLFPNEEVPLSRVLGNIASRGCLYAVVVTPVNQEHRSLTLNILHGLPQEHRNMPVDDAITLISRDFSSYKSAGRSVPLNASQDKDRHPDAVQVLLNMLADNNQLMVLQYDRVIKYLEVRREEQVQVELGDVKELSAPIVSDPKQVELQSRILNILNSNKPVANAPNPVPAPSPATSTSWSAASTGATTLATTTTTSSNAANAVTPSPLLNDPTVQKALDSLLQGNLLKKIGDNQPAATTAVTSSTSTPLFAAFSNISRF